MTPKTFMGFWMEKDGYGIMTSQVGAHITRLAPDVRQLDMRDSMGKFGGVEREWHIEGEACAVCVPEFLVSIHSECTIQSTMFEATRLPPGWVNLLNTKATAVIVPCKWNRDVFKENGITRPIHIAKLGIDPLEYYPLKRNHTSAPYTFLWSGTPDLRKGFDIAYQAFIKAFGGNKDTRLIMHWRALPRGMRGINDNNVMLITGAKDLPTMRTILQAADCYLFPSRGEGWGLPPREAAATGLPVIATNYSGLAEDIERWAMPLRVSGMSKAEYGYPAWGDIGDWAEPDIDHLIELMRWCFKNRTSAAHFGQAAAAWLRDNAKWETTARVYLEVMGCNLNTPAMPARAVLETTAGHLAA